MSFNPRARVGRDDCRALRAGNYKCFNPRARVGRDAWYPVWTSPPTCFNPRARVGRDQRQGRAQVPDPVSIHAPAWGATHGTIGGTHDRLVSIHAPAWGATVEKRSGSQHLRVSIHAPAWGATYGVDIPEYTYSFQSTRPRGARLSPSWTNTNYSTKQSYIQVTTRLTKITRPAVPQFRCQGTRANIPANRHHLPFARHRVRQLAEPQGHKVSLHQNAQPFFANSSRGYTRAGYLLTHQ